MEREIWLKTDLGRMPGMEDLGGYAFTDDSRGDRIGVILLKNGRAASVSGNVTANIIRNDGVTITQTGTLIGNRASVVLPSSAYAVSGSIQIFIKIGAATVGACRGMVRRSVTGTII